MTGLAARCALLATSGALVVVIDQVSKAVALRAWDEPIVLGLGVALRLSFNTGAAFSIGTTLTPLFTLAAAAVLAWIAWVAPRITTTGWAAALGLIGGGRPVTCSTG